MALLPRVLQKIFGSTGASSEFARIGSLAAASPVKTKDLDSIQSLSQYLSGLFGITASGAEPPRIEDINALYFLITSQLKYIFQSGIPEWITTDEYYVGSFVRVGSVVYVSKTGTDGSPNTGNNPATDTTNWGDFMNASNLSTGTIPLARIPSELTGKNAATATKLATARTIGGVSFDGTANINLPGVNQTGNQATSGNAASATKLATARTIALSTDVTASGSFDGSGNLTLVATLVAAKVLEKLRTVDGSGSLLDADLLDGQDGSFYRNASNLNAGTISLDLVPDSLTGKTADLAVLAGGLRATTLSTGIGTTGGVLSITNGTHYFGRIAGTYRLEIYLAGTWYDVGDAIGVIIVNGNTRVKCTASGTYWLYKIEA